MKKLILFLTGLLIVSCNMNKNEDKFIDTIKIKINKTDIDILSPDSVFDSVLYIPLETTDNSMMGEINTVKIFDSLIYISEKISERLFVFDFNGKHKGTLDKQGKSGTEYLYLEDYYVEKDNIYILSTVPRAILIYDKTNFSFKERINLPDYFVKFIFIKDKIILYSSYASDSGYALTTLNRSDYSIVNQFKEIPEVKRGVRHSNNPFFYDGKDLYATFENEYSLFKIVNDEYHSVLNVDFGEYRWDDYMQNASSREQHQYKMSLKLDNWLIESIHNVIVHDSEYIFTFVLGGNIYTCFFNPTTKTYRYGIIFGSLKYPLFCGGFEYYYDNYILQFSSADHVHSLVEKNADGVELPENLKNIKPEDNYVLCMYKLK